MISYFRQGMFRQWVASFAAIVLVFSLAACSDNKAKQESELTTFLQTEILQKNRVNLPALTEKERAEFGDFASQYELLLNFDEKIKHAFAPLSTSLQSLPKMSSVKEMMESKEKITKTRNELAASYSQLTQMVAQMEKEKALLVQSDALKGAYDQVYNRLVLEQLAVAKEGFPLLISMFEQALQIIDFIESKGESVSVLGNRVEFSSQEDVDAFNALNDKLQALQADYLSFSKR